MAIDKLNSLQFLFFRSDYFQEFGDRDGVYVDRVPWELRQRLLRWTWPTTDRDQYFFQHEGHDVITQEGWEVFVRWVCCTMDRQLGAEGEATGTIDGFIHALDGKVQPGTPMSIEDIRKIATAGWAGAMESVRLSGDPLGSLAGTDEIINRGDREAFAGLLHAIIEQPGGPVADRVRTLYERVQHRAGDPEFAAWPQYQAAYWLAVAMGQFRPADATSQRFASVWDAIEDDPAEAEKMKRWSALRMRADAMATLLCVQPVGREAMADEVQQWIDWWQPSYEAAQRLSADEIAALKTGGWWPPAADRQVAEMPPPVAQRQVPSDDPAILHALYTLADYPVLAALAAERTEATRLDGRACRAIYEDARQRIDWQAMPPHEREFAQRLGVGP